MTPATPPALFTPSTLTRIRTLARTKNEGEVAEELGWDVERLRRVARRHGVEIAPGAPRKVEAAPTAPAPASEASPIAIRRVVERGTKHSQRITFRIAAHDALSRECRRRFVSASHAVNELIRYIDAGGLWDEALK